MKEFNIPSNNLGNFDSDPDSGQEGQTYYNTTDNQLKIFNGTDWVSVGGGAVIADGEGTEEFLTKFSGGELANSSFEESQAGQIRATGKKLVLRNNTGEFWSDLLELYSQGYGSSFVIQHGDGTSYRTSAHYFSTIGGASLLLLLNSVKAHFYKPLVFDKVDAPRLTSNTVVTVSNPARRIILSADADGYSIYGLSCGQVDGMSVILENPTANSFNLEDSNINATASDRFQLPNSARTTIPTYSSITLIYNGTLARWLVQNFVIV